MPATNAWNETTPAGTDLASTIDNSMRTMKLDMRERMAVEHYWNASVSTDGLHKEITITPATTNTPLLKSVSNQSLTGSDASAIVDLGATWNTTGTPTAVKVTVTDTASNAASLLLDLRVGAASMFSVKKDGSVSFAGGTFGNVALLNAANSFTAANLITSTSGLPLRAGGSESNSQVGAGSLSAVRLFNTDTGSVGNLSEVQFAISNSTRFAAISGLLVNAANNTAGSIVISTRRVSTDATLTAHTRFFSTGGTSFGDTTDPGATNVRIAGTLAVVGTSVHTGASTFSAGLQITGDPGAGVGAFRLTGNKIIVQMGSSGLDLNNSGNTVANFAMTDAGALTIRTSITATTSIKATTSLLVGATDLNSGSGQMTLYASVPKANFGNSAVSHGMSDFGSVDLTGRVQGFAANGGLQVEGFTGVTEALYLDGNSASEDTTKSTAGAGSITLRSRTRSGTGVTTPGANVNLVVIKSNTTTRFIFDSDGDSHQDVGTAWTNFDTEDDIALLTAVSAGVSKPGDPVRDAFVEVLERNRKRLTELRLVTFNDDGHHFVNWSRLNMLTIGAVRQLAQQVQALHGQRG